MNDGLSGRPAERFAGPIDAIDLQAQADDLRARAATDPHGHAQRTVDRAGRVTVAMFAFRAGGAMREHRVQGVVTIHCLLGELTVTTPEGDRPLQADRMVRLSPGVVHGIEASTEAVILVHVVLDGD